MLPYIEAQPENCPSRNCWSFFPKLYFILKSHAHLQYACKIFAWFHTDCFKTLRVVDYVNLIRYIGVFNLYNVSVEIARLLSNIFFCMQKFTYIYSICMLHLCRVSYWLHENSGRTWLHKCDTLYWSLSSTLHWSLSSKLTKSEKLEFCQKLFFFFKKSPAHLQYTCTSNITKNFQNCLETLGEVAYTNLISNIEA